MFVKIAPLGEKVTEVNVEAGTTVGQAIMAADVDINGRSIRMDNVEVDEGTPITKENAVITLVNKMKGGR